MSLKPARGWIHRAAAEETFMAPSICLALLAVGPIVALGQTAGKASAPAPVARLYVEPGHPWTPPFGLERVGRPLDAVVEVPAGAKPGEMYTVVGYRDGKETSRRVVTLVKQFRRGKRLGSAMDCFGRVTLEDWPTEVALLVNTGAQARAAEVARAEVKPPVFEAEAVARPDRIIQPVDLGTIFVPADWLLLADGQKATVDVAALNRGADVAAARVTAWYQSAAEQKASAEVPLTGGRKALARLDLRPHSRPLKQDWLHVVVAGGTGKELWRKTIHVMLVPEAPHWPQFGAVATKLRYDAPIPARYEPHRISYDKGWDPKLKDVVVFFPNGARFVFWRGSSYCPFWAGRSNTGFCHEWAEILSGKHMVGKHDCAEPLQDKELRYGRVKIIESTPARVHLRWDYQSCDMDYKVWGDFASEDFFFYPDGFGTRVLTLTARPDIRVETGEFIIFTPQAGYPLEYLSASMADILWPEGKAEFRFPLLKGEQQQQWAKLAAVGKDVCLLHRFRFGKDDPLAAIQYSPWGSWHDLPGFWPFHDRGAQVTPAYWGCHWPLSRGYPTGWAISERIGETPAHSSLYHAGTPQPLHTQTGPMRTSQGKVTTMRRDTWVWLIGMTDADDAGLRRWMGSFGHAPALELSGAKPDEEPYVPERRALRLVVEKPSVSVTIKPVGWCVNPVFELRNAPGMLKGASLGGQALERRQYAWDGKTLWLSANLSQPTILRLESAE